jgi:segregation and condensation protein B
VPEISDIRSVDSGGVIGTLLDRKLITTAGRKQVIGRPILYKTTKEFLMRFGLKDVSELPSMEEFEKLVAESFQAELIPVENAEAAPANVEALESVDESEDTALEETDAVSPRASSPAEDAGPSEPGEIEKSAALRED